MVGQSGERGGVKTRLYLITPPSFALEGFAAELAQALDAGDVAAVQLRMKDVGDGPILKATERLIPIVQRAGAAFILNDRPDLAKRVGADGVHIGQDDMPYKEARALLGKDAMIGVTAHNSRHLAMQAAEAGADYVAFGSMFPTTTKEAKTRAEPDLIQWWSDIMEVPCVAIGGITVENAQPVIEAGADFLAVSAGVWRHKDGPAQAVRDFNRLFGR
jgi:thiamine-phosphate pyrophosphorylase